MNDGVKDSKMAKLSPLAPDLWFDRLGRLNDRLSTESIEIDQALRHAFHLSLLAPGPFADIIENSYDEESFEHLLVIERYDEAVELLVNSDVFDMSIDVLDGHAVVKITSALFNFGVEVVTLDKVSGTLQAWIKIILGFEYAALYQEVNPPSPTPHKPQSERHRLSTWH